ncbi:MAG: cysteine desulfurase [Treponema sp.]|nr:cysteine desulfurase [Treponema sp.]
MYADHAATTPLDPRALDAMLPFLRGQFYNPSALYPEAAEVRAAVETARSELLGLIGGAGRLVFTGSGTEAANLALRSALPALCGEPARILVSAAEHHAVLNCADSLAAAGVSVERLPVDRHGAVSPEILSARMGPGVVLVSVMSVNNETGALNDTAELCRIARRGGAKFHTDAVQALGVLPLCAEALGADYISVSAHKIYGPKGVGALYAAPGAPIFPIIRGGKQEGGARAGTENTAAIAGFGRAAALLRERLPEDAAHLSRLKAIFLDGIAAIPDMIVNSPPNGAPHIISVSVAGVEAEGCLLRLSMAGVLASMGAACNASSIEPSHVVEAIGVPAAYKRGTMRFSFGRDSTGEDAAQAAQELASAVAKSR